MRKIFIITVAFLIMSYISTSYSEEASTGLADKTEEVFGLYTATLDGKNMKPLITNSWQQMSHARVSPDKKWVTFTRYTNRGKDGYATENQDNYDRKGEQYSGTEVLIMRLDGTDVRTLIPHQKDKVAANSYWTPDGKGIIYVSAPNEKGFPQINHIIFDDDMQVKEITKLPIPSHIIPTDPHWVGEWVVFPAVDIKNRKRGIWRMRYDGNGLELLAETPKKAEMQDNDPKLSPDGSKVAFIRRVKEGAFFHAVIVDTNTKKEKDLSVGYLPENVKVALDGPPEWSSNGELLIFPHFLIDEKIALAEMHTIKPDGTGRKRVPLPRNYVYFHTSFFPGEGSSSNARIIFSTKKRTAFGKKYPTPEAAASGGYERNAIIGETAKNGTKCNKEFGLYIANLDGSNMKLLISDSYRQMTHARVSPDKEWIAFTRYNNIGKDGCAIPSPGNYQTEGQGYEETEILLMRLDGSDLRVLIPPKKGVASANSYWTPDGKGLVYIYGDGRKSRASHLIFDENMEIESDTEIPTPDYLGVVDPQWGKDSSGNDWIVFPARNRQTGKMGLWWVKPDGSGLEQLTFPEYQDNDPKISPDGTKIAFMRKVKEGIHWHNIILDLETREETDLSEGYFPENLYAGADLMPEWSSDGELLIFWHIYVDVDNQRPETPLQTIKPDGSERKKIPLPEGYVYSIVAFFPNEGSDDNTRIIFTAYKIKD